MLRIVFDILLSDIGYFFKNHQYKSKKVKLDPFTFIFQARSLQVQVAVF